MAQCIEALTNLLLGPPPQVLARQACRENNEKVLTELLMSKGARRVRVNERDPGSGYTLLAEAAEAGHNKCLKVLLEKVRRGDDGQGRVRAVHVLDPPPIPLSLCRHGRTRTSPTTRGSRPSRWP